MEINVKAIHFDISEKLIDFTNKKIDKMARRYDFISEADITLTLVKPESAKNKEAAIKFKVNGAADLFASKVADTFEEAIDLTLDALKSQLEKIKEKQ